MSPALAPGCSETWGNDLWKKASGARLQCPFHLPQLLLLSLTVLWFSFSFSFLPSIFPSFSLVLSLNTAFLWDPLQLFPEIGSWTSPPASSRPSAPSVIAIFPFLHLQQLPGAPTWWQFPWQCYSHCLDASSSLADRKRGNSKYPCESTMGHSSSPISLASQNTLAQMHAHFTFDVEGTNNLMWCRTNNYVDRFMLT